MVKQDEKEKQARQYFIDCGRWANQTSLQLTHLETGRRRITGEQGGWRGSNYMTGPGRTPGEFGQNVALGWNFTASDKEGATITNNADYYAFKVTGGRIIPKRVSYLTIPMVPEADGRRVRDYEGATDNILFRVLGKKALFEKTDNGGIRAVYALVKEVIHQPWPQSPPRYRNAIDCLRGGSDRSAGRSPRRLMINRPLTFEEAIEFILGKENVPTDEWDPELWKGEEKVVAMRTFFSARVENARFLDRARSFLFDTLADTTEKVTGPDGVERIALRGGDRGTFVRRMREFMIREGMVSGEEEFFQVNDRDVRDIRSERRLRLIYDTNMRQAYPMFNISPPESPKNALFLGNSWLKTIDTTGKWICKTLL